LERIIKTSQPLALEDSDSLPPVLLQRLEQRQEALERQQVNLAACLEPIIRTSQQQDSEDLANPHLVPHQLLELPQVVSDPTLVEDSLEPTTKINQELSVSTQGLLQLPPAPSVALVQPTTLAVEVFLEELKASREVYLVARILLGRLHPDLVEIQLADSVVLALIPAPVSVLADSILVEQQTPALQQGQPRQTQQQLPSTSSC